MEGTPASKMPALPFCEHLTRGVAVLGDGRERGVMPFDCIVVMGESIDIVERLLTIHYCVSYLEGPCQGHSRKELAAAWLENLPG